MRGGGGDVEEEGAHHHHQNHHHHHKGTAAVEDVHIVSILYIYIYFGKVFKCNKYCHTKAFDNNN